MNVLGISYEEGRSLHVTRDALRVTGDELLFQHKPPLVPCPFCRWHFPQRGKEKEDVFLGEKAEDTELHRESLTSHSLVPNNLTSNSLVSHSLVSQNLTSTVDNLLITFSPYPLFFSEKTLNTHTHTHTSHHPHHPF